MIESMFNRVNDYTAIKISLANGPTPGDEIHFLGWDMEG